jgi:hypothetical protein
MLRSNRNAGEWDFAKLKDFNFIKDMGFSSFELDKIFERFYKEDDFDA